MLEQRRRSKENAPEHRLRIFEPSDFPETYAYHQRLARSDIEAGIKNRSKYRTWDNNPEHNPDEVWRLIDYGNTPEYQGPSYSSIGTYDPDNQTEQTEWPTWTPPDAWLGRPGQPETPNPNVIKPNTEDGLVIEGLTLTRQAARHGTKHIGTRVRSQKEVTKAREAQ